MNLLRASRSAAAAVGSSGRPQGGLIQTSMHTGLQRIPKGRGGAVPIPKGRGRGRAAAMGLGVRGGGVGHPKGRGGRGVLPIPAFPVWRGR